MVIHTYCLPQKYHSFLFAEEAPTRDEEQKKSLSLICSYLAMRTNRHTLSACLICLHLVAPQNNVLEQKQQMKARCRSSGLERGAANEMKVEFLVKRHSWFTLMHKVATTLYACTFFLEPRSAH